MNARDPEGLNMPAAGALCVCGVRRCVAEQLHRNAYVQRLPFSLTRAAMRTGRRRRGSSRRRG